MFESPIGENVKFMAPGIHRSISGCGVHGRGNLSQPLQVPNDDFGVSIGKAEIKVAHLPASTP